MEAPEFLYPFALFLIKLFRLFLRIVLSVFKIPLKSAIENELKKVGVNINGPNPWDMKIHNDGTYVRVGYDGILGLGEAYMDGWWDCDRVDEASARILGGGLLRKFRHPGERLISNIQYGLFNLQTRQKAMEVAEKHYDLGNALFQSFLDPYMNYSCGYWKEAKDLNEAQRHKMDLIARKLNLSPGMRVLDIGCGWGGLCKYLAENYKVSVVGVTISAEGAKYGKEFCKGLPVDIRLQDYRDVNDTFDRIVSVGMFEHVGHKNYREFFEIAERCLINHGIFLLHTIGSDHDYESLQTEPWLTTYIFPNGYLPNHQDIPKYANNLFTIEDWHNFGAYYDKTLMAWHGNFVKNWPSIRSRFENPDRFYRMWSYYLKICAGAFRARKIQLWQVTLSKKGIPGGYISVR